MIYKFEELAMDTFESLEEQQIPISKLKAVALNFAQHRDSLLTQVPEEHNNELNTVYDIQSFLVKHRFISFINYRILEKIIERLGTSDDKRKLQEYLEIYGDFCKRSVFEVPSSSIANCIPNLEEKQLVVKVTSTQSTFTLVDLGFIQTNIAKVIGLDITDILVRDVKEGCVQVTFAVISGAYLFPLPPAQLEELSKLDIDIITQPNDEVENTEAPVKRVRAAYKHDYSSIKYSNYRNK